MPADNTVALAKLKQERAELEKQRALAQNQLFSVLGALQFCDYLIGVITKGPEDKETTNGSDPQPEPGTQGKSRAAKRGNSARATDQAV